MTNKEIEAEVVEFSCTNKTVTLQFEEMPKGKLGEKWFVITSDNDILHEEILTKEQKDLVWKKHLIEALTGESPYGFGDYWVDIDLGKLLNFESPKALVDAFYKIQSSELGNSFLQCSMHFGWYHNTVNYREKTFRAASFQCRLHFWMPEKIGDGITSLRCQKLPQKDGICLKNNELVIVSDLFAVRDVFGLPEFNLYQWMPDGLVITYNKKEHIDSLVEFFEREFKEVYIDNEKNEIIFNGVNQNT